MIKTFRLNFKYQVKTENWLSGVELKLSEFNNILTQYEWNSTFKTALDDQGFRGQEIFFLKNKWKNKVCESKINGEWLSNEQKRKLYFLCRGMKYSDDNLWPHFTEWKTLGKIYNSPICINENNFELFELARKSLNTTSRCLYGEPDMEKLMKNITLSAEELKSVWLNWHNFIGPRMKNHFYTMIMYENEAARNNGYKDASEIWKEELEIPNLENKVQTLYNEVKPIYVLLHAVIRHYLARKYGSDVVDPKGPIPIHLLGNLWGQDWSQLIDFLPLKMKLNLNDRMKNKYHNFREMVLSAEDFYTSLSFPKMTDKFWKYSVFDKAPDSSICHGSAGAFGKDDYRIIMCGESNMEDFYVIHHEIGHIEYYMAYAKQSTLFQDGANSAIHESIGDAIWHGVITPQHLHRLGLLTDEELFDKNIELHLLLLQALNRVPELPYAFLLDTYRWQIFNGEIGYKNLNKEFWKLNLEYRGIVPPENRSETYFDAGGKFHIADNTPYTRYFLSSFMHMDIFKALCEIAIFGRAQDIPASRIPLHRCDIYGSKTIGKKLKNMMEKGSSIDWIQFLGGIAGHRSLTSKPFIEYYNPAYKWLQNHIEQNNIYVGW